MGKKPSIQETNKKLRLEVFRLCDSLGFWNVRLVQTAKELGTAHQNISRWKQQYVDKFGIPCIEKIGKELNINSQIALKELILIMKTGKPNIKVQAARAFFESVEKFTKFLENFSYKEKVAEKIDMGGIEFNIMGIEDKYPDVEEKKEEEKEE